MTFLSASLISFFVPVKFFLLSFTSMASSQTPSPIIDDVSTPEPTLPSVSPTKSFSPTKSASPDYASRSPPPSPHPLTVMVDYEPPRPLAAIASRLDQLRRSLLKLKGSNHLLYLTERNIQLRRSPYLRHRMSMAVLTFTLPSKLNQRMQVNLPVDLRQLQVH